MEKGIEIINGKEKEIPKEIFEKALKLRYEIYRKVGFISENKDKRDYDEYDDKALHIVALDNNKVVGYLRLIKEMPLLSLYKKEVEEIKEKNKFRNPIEISRFVIDEKYRISERKIIDYDSFVSFLLFKRVYNYILKNKIDSVFIVTHPKYRERYEKFYYFKQYGEEKKYSAVEGNPAILLYQDVKKAFELGKVKNKDFYKFMIENEKN